MEWLASALVGFSVLLGIAVWIYGYWTLQKWAPPVPVTIGIAILLIVRGCADAAPNGMWITIPIGVLVDTFLLLQLYWWWKDRKDVKAKLEE